MYIVLFHLEMGVKTSAELFSTRKMQFHWSQSTLKNCVDFAGILFWPKTWKKVPTLLKCPIFDIFGMDFFLCWNDFVLNFENSVFYCIYYSILESQNKNEPFQSCQNTFWLIQNYFFSREFWNDQVSFWFGMKPDFQILKFFVKWNFCPLHRSNFIIRWETFLCFCCTVPTVSCPSWYPLHPREVMHFSGVMLCIYFAKFNGIFLDAKTGVGGVTTVSKKKFQWEDFFQVLLKILV